MVTPHINANKEDFSNLVIMSGDPIRVQYIAKNFLKDVIQITDIRNMLGFTGYYKNFKISVMSHGMGIPSSAIYVEELINFYHVSKIIRLGTCGTINHKIHLKDIIIAMGACTDSHFNRNRFNNYDFSAIADFDMIYNTVNYSKKLDIKIHIGNFFTTDSFYIKDQSVYNLLDKFNILGVDMETAGIYSICSENNIKSMSMCLVSDHITLNKKISIKERELNFNHMVQLALNTIIS